MKANRNARELTDDEWLSVFAKKSKLSERDIFWYAYAWYHGRKPTSRVDIDFDHWVKRLSHTGMSELPYYVRHFLRREAKGGRNG